MRLQFRFQQNCQIAIANRFRFGIEETTSFFISCCVGRIENRNCNSNRANGIAISISANLWNCNCKEISISNRRKYIIFHRLLCWPNTRKYINFGKLVKMKVKKQFLLMNLLQNCFPSKMQTQNIVRSKYQ